jgi:hypothetical protein
MMTCGGLAGNPLTTVNTDASADEREKLKIEN